MKRFTGVCTNKDGDFCKLSSSIRCPYSENAQLDCEDYAEHCVADAEVPFEFECEICHEKHTLMLDPMTLMRYLNRACNITEAFPHLSADDRELIISGICGKCYDAMFSNEDENDDTIECAHELNGFCTCSPTCSRCPFEDYEKLDCEMYEDDEHEM